MFFDTKNLLESNPELPGHGAVEDEVDHAVGEGHHVHHLPQGGVAGDEELVAQHPRQHAQNTLQGIKSGYFCSNSFGVVFISFNRVGLYYIALGLSFVSINLT